MNNVHDTKLNIRVSGEGYPVVFLHGFLESSNMWTKVLPDFTKNILFDLPGHGRTEVLVNSISEMADLVIDGLTPLINEEYIVVGHSMGGYVGMEMIRRDPRCKHVVLLNSNYWEDSAEKKLDRDRVANIVHSKKNAFIYEAIPNLFHDPSQHDREVKTLIREAVLMTPEAIAASSIAMKNRSDNSELLRSSSDNFTVVQGSNDPVVDCSTVCNFCKETGVEYFELDSGHMSYIEIEGSVKELLKKMIKKITETN